MAFISIMRSPRRISPHTGLTAVIFCITAVVLLGLPIMVRCNPSLFRRMYTVHMQFNPVSYYSNGGFSELKQNNPIFFSRVPGEEAGRVLHNNPAIPEVTISVKRSFLLTDADTARVEYDAIQPIIVIVRNTMGNPAAVPLRNKDVLVVRTAPKDE